MVGKSNSQNSPFLSDVLLQRLTGGANVLLNSTVGHQRRGRLQWRQLMYHQLDALQHLFNVGSLRWTALQTVAHQLLEAL